MKTQRLPPVLPRLRKLDDLINRLAEVCQAPAESENPLQEKLKDIHPTYLKSTRNLAIGGPVGKRKSGLNCSSATAPRLTRPLVLRHGKELFGHTTVHAQLGCCQEQA
jgi:hypothetical protein